MQQHAKDTVESSEPRLIELAREGTVQEIDEWLESKGPVDVRGDNERTALMEAVQANRPREVIERLVKAGIAVDAKDDDQRTALSWAAQNHEDPDVLELLLDEEAEVDGTDWLGKTPLWWAASENPNPEVVQVLLDAGADIDTLESDLGNPLHAAVSSNPNLEVLKRLVDEDANVHARAKYGSTPLHWVFGKRESNWNETLPVIEVLVNAGARLDAWGDEGLTPLMQAAWHGNLQQVKWLLNADVDVKTRNEYGETALFIAAWTNETAEIAQALIDAGADVHAQDKHGRTALMEAARHNNLEVLKVLLETDARVNTRTNRERKTALHLAVESSENSDVLKLLLDNGADPTLTDKSGKTAYDYLQSNNVISTFPTPPSPSSLDVEDLDFVWNDYR